jgi:hypothetical protein
LQAIQIVEPVQGEAAAEVYVTVPPPLLFPPLS